MPTESIQIANLFAMAENDPKNAGATAAGIYNGWPRHRGAGPRVRVRFWPYRRTGVFFPEKDTRRTISRAKSRGARSKAFRGWTRAAAIMPKASGKIYSSGGDSRFKTRVAKRIEINVFFCFCFCRKLAKYRLPKNRLLSDARYKDA